MGFSCLQFTVGSARDCTCIYINFHLLYIVYIYCTIALSMQNQWLLKEGGGKKQNTNMFSPYYLSIFYFDVLLLLPTF